MATKNKAGSRKGTIHELFDQQGEEVAWTRGIKIGLKGGHPEVLVRGLETQDG